MFTPPGDTGPRILLLEIANASITRVMSKADPVRAARFGMGRAPYGRFDHLDSRGGTRGMRSIIPTRPVWFRLQMVRPSALRVGVLVCNTPKPDTYTIRTLRRQSLFTGSKYPGISGVPTGQLRTSIGHFVNLHTW